MLLLFCGSVPAGAAPRHVQIFADGVLGGRKILSGRSAVSYTHLITAEFPEYYVVTVYTPNSQNELARLPYRMQWEEDFLAYLKKLEEKKPVIFCGDLNVAHREIDLKNPKTNRKNAGFTDEERAKFSHVLESGFIDTYRYFYPDQEGVYSWCCLLYTSRCV